MLHVIVNVNVVLMEKERMILYLRGYKKNNIFFKIFVKTVVKIIFATVFADVAQLARAADL